MHRTPHPQVAGTASPLRLYIPRASLALALFALASADSLPAQSGVAPVSSNSDETVNLPQFQVRDTRSSEYAANEATSTSRISVPIIDIPQSVAVVTRELMNDTGGFRMLDTAKYVTPIMESSLGYGGDRYTLRGFQISQRFVDGVNVSGQDGYNMTSDTTNIERLEIIKGPNAILVPGGSPGGIVNQITKSPRMNDFAVLSYEYKEYLNNEGSIDVNRVFGAGGNDAARLVVSGWDQNQGYYNNQFRRGWLVAPSYTHLLDRNNDQIMIKLETLYNDEGQGYGTVLDPSVGTNGTARIAPYIPRDWSWGEREAHRRRWETRLLSELDLHLGDVSSRLWLMVDHATRNDRGVPAGTPVAGTQGSYNPLTGIWTPFVSYTWNAATRTATATPLVPSMNETYIRSGQANLLKFDEAHFKNDYAYTFQPITGATSTTIAGVSANFQRLSWKNLTATNIPVDFNNLAATEFYNPASTVYTLNKDKAADEIDGQIFGYERLTFFDNRVILAGGLSQFYGVLTRLDSGNLPLTNAAPNFYPYTLTGASTDLNSGVIYKPLKTVSVFVGYNRVGGVLPSSITAGENPKNFLVQQGDQLEGGVKTSFLQGRLNVSFSLYKITQNNFGVANAAFITDPTQPQFLYYDFTSKGGEIEFNTLLTPNLEFIGNYTHLRMRSSYGVPYRMVPDNEGAAFLKYTFRQGVAKGFNASVGVDYMGRAAGDQAAGVTVASTPGNLIPNQPSFYVAQRTLLQVGVGFEQPRWTIRALVDNATNHNYIQTAGSRTSLLPGLPRTYTGEFTYKF